VGASASDNNHRFATTRWSLVVAAAQDRASSSNQALAELCRAYWYPLYAFVRRKGSNAEDALDLTQGFFSRMLEKNDLAMADQSRGRFRSFLLASLTHYLANEHDREGRLKRGGDKDHISFELKDAESRYRLEPEHELTPEKLFDRRWALMLLDRVLISVRDDYERDGNADLFAGLKDVLTFSPDTAPYGEIATRLGMTEGAVKVAVHRLRKRYRERLLQTIADSVASEEDVEAEIRDLFMALTTH